MTIVYDLEGWSVPTIGRRVQDLQLLGERLGRPEGGDAGRYDPDPDPASEDDWPDFDYEYVSSSSFAPQHQAQHLHFLALTVLRMRSWTAPSSRGGPCLMPMDQQICHNDKIKEWADGILEVWIYPPHFLVSWSVTHRQR